MLSSSTYPHSFLLSRAAASSSSRPTSFSRSFLPAPSSIFARSTAPPGRSCIRCFSFRVRRMDELVQDKDATEKRAVVASGTRSEQQEVNKEGRHSRTFIDVRSEEELLSGIRKEVEIGRLPLTIAEGMEELYHNYKNAVFESGIPRADEIVLSNMSVCLDRILLDVEESFVFSPYHKAMREPFDYYMFGQNYIRPLVNFKNSYVGNITIFSEIQERIQQGHNVVLISNHQTEADPAVIALLLESVHQYIAENLTYIAGDRVVTDPLCKPFSMGRNLLCVYSKKHMNDVPELAEMKRRSNTRSLKEMALLLRGGSQLIWIAPSGGRDRPDPVTGEWHPAPFDSSAVDNMRRLVEHCGVPGHIYPLALHCYDIMPPPPQVEKEIGEKRVIAFRGAGLSAKPSLNLNDINATCENPDQAKEAYSDALYNSVSEQYQILKSAIQGSQGLEASTPTVSLSQPWD